MKAITSNFNANTEKHTHTHTGTHCPPYSISLTLTLAGRPARTHTHMSFKFYTHCRLMAQVIFYCRRLLPLSDLDSACLIQITKIHTRIQAHTQTHTNTHYGAHTYTYNDSSATSFALFELFSFSVCLPSHESRSLCVQCVCVCLFAVCVRVCVRISCVLMNLYRQPALLFVNAVN